jgi:glutathione S-transferase
MAGLTFYTNPMSRGRTARWMLEEVGQPYRTVVLEFGPAMKAPEYLAINPMGKVPALVHGGAVVTEVAAICAYLADAFPGAALAPPTGDLARAAYLRWLFFGAGPLEAALTNQGLGVSVPEDRRVGIGYGSVEAVLDAIEGALAASPYLAGERFSAADVHVGSQLAWAMRFGLIEPRPAFARYVERIGSRPAALRARGIDDALMREAGSADGGTPAAE